jgi:hypothetical protein
MSDPERAASEKRVQRAKRASALLLEFTQGPRAALVPSELKAALADLVLLVIELAQLSHAQFDMGPFDLADLVHRVDALDGLTGEGGGLPQLRRRIEALERKS